MADTAAKIESPVVSTPKVKKTSVVKSPADKKPRIKSSHPPTAEMVNIAIGTLKERGGSSLQAIKKYLAANYQTDSDKLAPFIKKYLKAAVINGTLIQVKGKGASGSFKLAPPAKKAKAEKKPTDKVVKKVNKKKALKSPKRKSAAVIKKSSPTKKSVIEKKKAVVKQAAAAKKTGTVKTVAPKEKVTRAPIKAVVKKPKTVQPVKKVTAPAPKKVASPVKKAAAKK